MSEKIIRIPITEAIRRREEFRNNDCRIWDQHHAAWWLPDYHGYTEDKESAGIYSARRPIDDRLIDVDLDIIFEVTGEPAVTEGGKQPIRLTYPQVRAVLDKIANKMCRWVQQDLYVKKPVGTGYTSSVNDAQEFQVRTLVTHYEAGSRDMLFEMLDQAEAARIAAMPVRLCILEESLPATIIDGLRLHPRNPTYQALVMQHLGKHPPADLETFDAIKEWIEFNCTPLKKLAPTAPPRPPDNPRFYIPVAFSQMATGRCRFTVSQSGNMDYVFRVEDIRESIVNGVESLDALLEDMEQQIQENAWSMDPEMEDDDDPELDSREITNTSNHGMHYDLTSQIGRDRLIAFMRANLAPEYLEQIGL